MFAKKVVYSLKASEKLPGETEIRRNPQVMETGPIARPSEDQNTFQDVWVASLKANSKNVLLAQRDKKTNKYVPRTYAEVDKICQEIGSGIQNLNLADSLQEYKDFNLQMVGIYAKNREEWIMVDIGCGIMQGMTIVPLYDTLGPENLSYCLNHSAMSVVFASSPSVDNLLNQDDIGKLRNIVAFDEITPEQREKSLKKNIKIYSLGEVRDAGRKNIRPLASVTPETIFTFSYTSGTTGKPKAAMLNHKNITSMIAVLRYNKDIRLTDKDVHLSYLPLPHVFDRAVCSGIIAQGGAIYFYSGDPLKIKEDLADVRPTFFVSVPRLYNKFYDAIMGQINSSSFIKKFLGNVAINSKLKNLKSTKSLDHQLWDKLVFSKIRNNLFGGRIRYLLTASAPINKEVIDFFQIACSAPMVEGYGQTESSAATFVTSFDDMINGHVGGPQVNMDFKLVDIPDMNYLSTDVDAKGNPAPRGEICFKGPGVFAGYYKDEEKTNEAIDGEGWLHSGDVGIIDMSTGSLKIIDRKKNIFKLSQGEYVAPEKIESIYSKTAGVAEVFVYGDSLQYYLVGVVVPEKQHIENLAKSLNIDASFEELCKNKEIKKRVCQDLIDQGKKNKLFGFEQIKNVHLEPVSMQVHGCLTNTMKIQRHNAREVFQKQIEDLYSEGLIV